MFDYSVYFFLHVYLVCAKHYQTDLFVVWVVKQDVQVLKQAFMCVSFCLSNRPRFMGLGSAVSHKDIEGAPLPPLVFLDLINCLCVFT